MLVALLALAIVVLGLASWRQNDKRLDRRTRDSLLESADAKVGVFALSMTEGLPEPAQRYFRYSITPGTPLRTVVEIEMRGQLGLGSKERPGYRSMEARQVLAPPHGLVWQLEAGPISGSDGVTSSTSWTRFWAFGLVPIVRAGGTTDHHRSARGRVVAEGAFWVPASLLVSHEVFWEAADPDSARAVVRFGDFEQALELTVADDGKPTRIVIQRWSNANAEKEYRFQAFGGYLSEFREFDGYRLPTRVEGGNLIGTDDYFPFFRAEVGSLRFVGS